MRSRTACAVTLGAIVCVVLIPQTAVAQRGTGTIAGTVRDATGAVLPGTTVEATSPALIEKVRSAVADETGQYKLIELRPGVYTVTFSLSGFSTVKRDGIELMSDFTATVNAELKVGAMEETITVSGSTPVVDVQNVVQQRVFTRDVLDAVPTGKYYQNIGALIPGIVIGGTQTISTQDVGGTLGNVSATMGIHGSRPRDQQVLIDGMNVATVSRNDTTTMVLQDGNVEEMSLLVGVNPAESEAGGVRFNLIPKDGGNRFSGAFFTNVANSSLQANNVDAELQAAGLREPNRLQSQYDLNPSLGGPIRRDALWFYSAYRYFYNNNYVGGVYFSQDPTSWTYTPDRTRQGFIDQLGHDGNARLTWQATRRNKFTAYFDYNHNCDCHRYTNATTTPEASLFLRFKNNLTQGTWSSPVTNRLLVEAGVSALIYRDNRDRQTLSTEDPITEANGGLNYRARAGGPFHIPGRTYNVRASLSYVTGSHAFKVGYTLLSQGATWKQFQGPGDVAYTLLAGRPNSVTYYATPFEYVQKVNPNIGVFVQDQWTRQRLTLNLGLRMDHLETGYGAVDLPATRWMGPREFSSGDVLNWTDLSPRLSAAYDLFGNGKTALKGSVSRYVLQQGIDFTSAVNPVLASNNTTTRVWTDNNNDFTVQGDPLNPAANAELGVSSNRNFGRTVFTTRYDPRLTEGFQVRPYNWEVSAGVQHELMPLVSISAMYYRRWFGNFNATENQAYAASDYTPYCIAAPRDQRLPGGGGNPICGLFDIDPARVPVGAVNNVGNPASVYGRVSENWQGGDIIVNARLRDGFVLQGGLSSGKTTVDTCGIWQTMPQVTVNSSLQVTGSLAAGGAGRVGDFCRQETPFLTQIKFLGSYALPAGFQVSGTFQSVAGDAVFANYVATNGVILPSLGRNLSAGAGGTVTLNIVPPGTMYLDRMNQLDVRATRDFRAGTTRVRAMIDFYNVLNNNTVLTVNPSYGTNGATWMVPQVIMPGRLIKFAAQLNF